MGGSVRVLKSVPRISQECSRHCFQPQCEESTESVDLWEGTGQRNG